MSTRAKPSDIHNDESGELLKKRAEAANRKRRERQEELKRKENIRQREEFRKAKAEQEAKEREENEERVRKAAEEAAKGTKEKKEPNKGSFGKKIKTEVDGESFDSLAKAMAWVDPVLWGKENAYRTSCWIKINRALKRDGECEFGGHKYRMI